MFIYLVYLINWLIDCLILEFFSEQQLWLKSLSVLTQMFKNYTELQMLFV